MKQATTDSTTLSRIARPKMLEAVAFSKSEAEDAHGVSRSTIVPAGMFALDQHEAAWNAAKSKCEEIGGVGFTVERQPEIAAIQAVDGGQTIEDARRIVAAIEYWGEINLAQPQSEQLTSALNALQKTLTSGWTEVDEALCRISSATWNLNRCNDPDGSIANGLEGIKVAIGFLHRWQGRNGRIGNVA